jgi:hypothetical protein
MSSGGSGRKALRQTRTQHIEHHFKVLLGRHAGHPRVVFTHDEATGGQAVNALPEDLHHQLDVLRAPGQQAHLGHLADQFAGAGVGVLRGVAVLHAGGLVGRMGPTGHEDEGVFVRVLHAKAHIGAAQRTQARPAGLGLRHRLLDEAGELQQVFVHRLGDERGLVAKQRVHDGGGVARQFGHFAQRDFVDPTLANELAHDLDDGLATLLSLAGLALLGGGQGHERDLRSSGFVWVGMPPG